MKILTEQEIKRIGEGNTGSWQDDLQFARAIESAVLEKLKNQTPFGFCYYDELFEEYRFAKWKFREEAEPVYKLPEVKP